MDDFTIRDFLEPGSEIYEAKRGELIRHKVVRAGKTVIRTDKGRLLMRHYRKSWMLTKIAAQQIAERQREGKAK